MGKSGFLGRIFANWWWVLALLSITYMLYWQSMREKQKVLTKLQERIETLQEQKMLALTKQEELASMIASQSDPAWIEMTLIKQMGVVPEGKRKVQFMP